MILRVVPDSVSIQEHCSRGGLREGDLQKIIGGAGRNARGNCQTRLLLSALRKNSVQEAKLLVPDAKFHQARRKKDPQTAKKPVETAIFLSRRAIFHVEGENLCLSTPIFSLKHAID